MHQLNIYYGVLIRNCSRYELWGAHIFMLQIFIIGSSLEIAPNIYYGELFRNAPFIYYGELIRNAPPW